MGKKEVENYIERVKFGRSYRKYAKDLAKFGDGLVSDLIKVLKESDEDVRKTAVDALRKIGPDAEAAVPALIEATNKDTDADVRHAAEWALMNIRRKE